MKNIDGIITEYETADFGRRLDLFLQYPLLRKAFAEIDQKCTEMPEKIAARTDSKKPSVWRRLLAYAQMV
jgi:hypothetical protein